MMNTIPRSVHLFILVCLCINQLASAQDQNQFIFNGFRGANLYLNGPSEIHSNGLLQLTNTSRRQAGHSFYPIPLNFNQSLSFSSTFVFAIVPEFPDLGGNGLAFTVSPSMDFSTAIASQFLGLFNSSSNGLSSNHILAVEFDTIMNPEFGDINENHVGIDLNGLRSNDSATAAYFSDSEGISKNLTLISGDPIQVWIDYDDIEMVLSVTLAPMKSPKPNRPLLSTRVNLSEILLDTMYVGFSSSTGSMSSSHYILGWSFSRNGQAQSLELSELPPIPRQKRSGGLGDVEIVILVVTVSILLITVLGSSYIVWRKKFEEIEEDWEKEYGTQRFSYRELYRATKGFRNKELLGSGGFGQVFRGTLPSSNRQVAVKKVSHDSKQGMKEFVAEIASMGRLRHRNLVQLLGYCRRRGELLLVYDYMPNGSLDKYLFSNEKPTLGWAHRFRIVKGVASGLLYLHEEWEQVVLHRDVKASNVLLDADMNGRLGDFGLARLYDHGANPQTTHMVGTIGYLAPELTRTGKATMWTDVFAFGAFLLEVACGRRPIQLRGLSEDLTLLEKVFESWKKGDLLEMVDPRLVGDYVVEEMELVLRLGLLCSQTNPGARPSMRQVMQYLEGDAILPQLHLDGVRVGMVSVTAEASFEFAMSFPSSSGTDSVINISI